MSTFYSIHDYYISHHGIKGQKWGIRRYQNPDGTLTELGKKRYGTVENMQKTRERSKQRMIKIAKGLGIAAVGVGAVMAAPALGKGIKSLYIAALKKIIDKTVTVTENGWTYNVGPELRNFLINLLNKADKVTSSVKVSAGATKIR